MLPISAGGGYVIDPLTGQLRYDPAAASYVKTANPASVTSSPTAANSAYANFQALSNPASASPAAAAPAAAATPAVFTPAVDGGDSGGSSASAGGSSSGGSMSGSGPGTSAGIGMASGNDDGAPSTGNSMNMGLGPAGASAPNVASFAQANDVNTQLAGTAFGLGTAALGPVGVGMTAANYAGNVANTTANANMMANIGAPMSTAQVVGGLLGQNQYAGTPTAALNAMMSNPGTSGAARASMSPAQMGPGYGPAADPQNPIGAVGTAPTVGVTSAPLAAAPAAPQATTATVGMMDDNTPTALNDYMGGADSANDGSEAGGQSSDLGGLYAFGGRISGPSTPFRGGHVGFVPGYTGGQADKVQTYAPKNGFVVPADVVSALGSGNSMAGANQMNKLIGPQPSASVVPTTPIHTSGGEFIVHPTNVAKIGGGDVNAGHAALRNMVQGIRQHAAQSAMTMPPPV